MEIASSRGRFAPWTHGRHAAMGACIYLSNELRWRASSQPFEALAIIGNTGERRRLLVEPAKFRAARTRDGAAFRKCLSRLPTSPTFSRRVNRDPRVDHGICPADDWGQRVAAPPWPTPPGSRVDA